MSPKKNTFMTKIVKFRPPLQDRNAKHDRTGSYSATNCKGIMPDLHTWAASSATELCDRHVMQELQPTAYTCAFGSFALLMFSWATIAISFKRPIWYFTKMYVQCYSNPYNIVTCVYHSSRLSIVTWGKNNLQYIQYVISNLNINIDYRYTHF
jgi:hypothetical protein